MLGWLADPKYVIDLNRKKKQDRQRLLGESERENPSRGPDLWDLDALVAFSLLKALNDDISFKVIGSSIVWTCNFLDLMFW